MQKMKRVGKGGSENEAETIDIRPTTTICWIGKKITMFSTTWGFILGEDHQPCAVLVEHFSSDLMWLNMLQLLLNKEHAHTRSWPKSSRKISFSLLTYAPECFHTADLAWVSPW